MCTNKTITLLAILCLLFPIGQVYASLSASIFHTSDSDFGTGTHSQTAVDTGNGRVRLAPQSCGSATYSFGGLNYGTVSANGRCWLDRNLGATQVATAYNDSNAYGWLYQWGRLTDGHQIRTSGTSNTRSSTDVPGHANFIYYNTYPSDWRNPQNDNLSTIWGGMNGTSSPCPSGWRLPTQAEWASVISALGITNRATAFSSVLKITVGGWRDSSNGVLSNVGSSGYYWSSNISAVVYATDSCFDSTMASADWTQGRASGNSVRCILDANGSLPYYSSGTYTSTIFQRQQLASWGNLTYGATLNGQGLGIKVRSCAAADCAGGDDWGTCTAIASGNSLASGGCVSDSEKFIQYRAEFTSDTTNTAYLNDITLDYLYNPDTTLMSGIVKFFGNIIFK